MHGHPSRKNGTFFLSSLETTHCNKFVNMIDSFKNETKKK